MTTPAFLFQENLGIFFSHYHPSLTDYKKIPFLVYSRFAITSRLRNYQKKRNKKPVNELHLQRIKTFISEPKSYRTAARTFSFVILWPKFIIWIRGFAVHI